MNKVLKWGLIIGGVIIFLIVVSSGDKEVTDRFKEGYEEGRRSQEVVIPKTVPTKRTEIDNFVAEFQPINEEFKGAMNLGSTGDYKGAIPLIESAHRKAKTLIAPEAFRSPHQKWVKAIGLNKRAMYLASEGTDTGDIALLNDAIDLMEQGNALIVEGTAELNKISETMK